MRINNKSGIPSYAAVFADPTTFVVAGGGGQGAHGVKNKVIVYKILDNDVGKLSEVESRPNSDSPTSMAIDSERNIWSGANIPSDASDEIKHLVHLKLDKDNQLSMVKQYDLFKSKSIATYQKSTSVAGTMVAAASSANPGLVAVLSTASEDVLDINFGGELMDATMSDYNEKEQRYVAGALASEIQIRTINKPHASTTIPAPQGGKWSRIVSVAPGKFVAAATLGGRAGSKSCVIDVQESGEAKLTHSLAIPAFKGVTALTTNGSRVAVASSTGDVYVYNVRFAEPSVVAQSRYVHKLPVTAVALNESGDAVVSTSLDGSFSVNTDLNVVVSLKATLGWAFLSALIIMVLALLVTIVSFPVPGFEGIPPPSLRDIRQSFEEFKQAAAHDAAQSVSDIVESMTTANPSIESLYVQETVSTETEDPSAVLGTAPGPTQSEAVESPSIADAEATPDTTAHEAEAEPAATGQEETGSEREFKES